MSLLETEIKLPAPDPATAHARLLDLGFTIKHPRTFEANIVFDTPSQELRVKRQLLRLRDYGPQTVLTFKNTPMEARHKTREELEVALPPGSVFPLILERLGFQPTFRYEKYRTEFTAPNGPGVATLDETPIGTFFELEGPPDWIDTVAAQLGYREADYINHSYARLFSDYAAEHPTDPQGMVFRQPPE